MHTRWQTAAELLKNPVVRYANVLQQDQSHSKMVLASVFDISQRRVLGLLLARTQQAPAQEGPSAVLAIKNDNFVFGFLGSCYSFRKNK